MQVGNPISPTNAPLGVLLSHSAAQVQHGLPTTSLSAPKADNAGNASKTKPSLLLIATCDCV